MKQHYIDERTGIRYTLQGDYYWSDLILPIEKENVIEKLKAENQMLWVQKMNNIRNRVMEVVKSNLIFD